MKEGVIYNYLEALTRIGLVEKQQHFMEWKLKISKDVKLFPLKNIFGYIYMNDYEKYMRKMGLGEKGCYPNAAKMVYRLFRHLPKNVRIRYVEGYVHSIRITNRTCME